jgi:hypothetical protein
VEWVQVVIGALAALATLWAVWYAREAARSGKDAVEAARQTVEAAERSRVADEHDRRRRRLERVGELIERMAGNVGRVLVGGGSRVDWWPNRDELRYALVGLHDDLPQCTSLLDVKDESAAVDALGRAREEVEAALRELDAES